jgi:hypothetical protein
MNTLTNTLTAHYFTWISKGKRQHIMEIAQGPSLVGSKKHTFDTAKEAKAFAKQIGAQAWNY